MRTLCDNNDNRKITTNKPNTTTITKETMDLEDFTNSQKPLYVIKPKRKRRLILNEEFENINKKKNQIKVPFISLNQNEEEVEATYKRWLLYNDLSLEFHRDIDIILEKSNKKTDQELKKILKNTRQRSHTIDNKENNNNNENNFKNVFLVGADNSFKLPKWKYNKNKETTTTNSSDISDGVGLKEDGEGALDEDTFTVVIEITSPESPNVRMMTKRTMFQLLNKITDHIEIEYEEELVKEDLEGDGDKESSQLGYDLKTISDLGLEYDLSIVQNFKKVFKKNLKIVFNYKEMDIFNFQVLDDWINTIYNLSRQCFDSLEIINVFQITTNLSNIEKNLKIKTIRILKSKGNFHVLKINDQRSLNIIINEIFKSFLKLSNGKLIFSSRFISDIIIKLKNSIDSKKKLIHTLIKILDYSLMTYFFTSSFSIFLDIINFETFFNEDYAESLMKCPSFMNYVENILLNAKEDNTKKIEDLLSFQNNRLNDLFVEMLVKPNPITKNLLQIIEILQETYTEEKNMDFNYNIFELYYYLSTNKNGSLKKYLMKNWPLFFSSSSLTSQETILTGDDEDDDVDETGVSEETKKNRKTIRSICSKNYKDMLMEDYLFHELFTLDNKKINGIISQNLFPSLRGNIEENLLNSDRLNSKMENESNFKMAKIMEYPINYLFTLYREAGAIINVYDFYSAFKSVLPKDDIINFWKETTNNDDLPTIKKILEKDGEEMTFDKISLIWFMQCITDMKYTGILKNESVAKRKFNGIVEKEIWRGL